MASDKKEQANCLICLHPQTTSITLTFPSFPGMTNGHFLMENGKRKKEDDKSNQISIFLLRHLLLFPEKEFRILERKSCGGGGVNPGSWCSVCDRCSDLVHHAFQVHSQIGRLQGPKRNLKQEEKKKKLDRQMVLLRMEALAKLKKSFMKESGNDKDSLSVGGMIRDYYKRHFSVEGKAGQGQLEIEIVDVEDNVEEEEAADVVCLAAGVDVDNDNKASKKPKIAIGVCADEIAAISNNYSKRPRSTSSPPKNQPRSSGGRFMKSKKSIKVDLKSASVGRNVFQCEQCQEIIKSEAKYISHMEKHRTTCERCGFTDRCSEKLAVHVRSHKINDNIVRSSVNGPNGKRQFSCKMCDFVGIRTVVYRHISNAHFADETFVCPICSSPFSSRKNVQRHMQRVHEKTPEYKCHCGKLFMTPYCLASHIKTHADDERNGNKDQPGENRIHGEMVEGTNVFEHVKNRNSVAAKFPREEPPQIEIHQEEHDDESQDNQDFMENNDDDFHGESDFEDDPDFACSEEDEAANTADKEKDDDSPSPCSEANTSLKHKKTTRSQTKLPWSSSSKSLEDNLKLPSTTKVPKSKSNVKSPKEKSLHKCEKCDATFEEKKQFINHLKQHRMSCEICGYENRRYEQLSVHMRKHRINDNIKRIDVVNGRQQFACKLCDFIGHRDIVYRHISNTHFVNETFMCQFCPNTFTLKRSLTLHIQIFHADELEFKCHCGKGFMTQDGLEKHQRSVHDKEKQQTNETTSEGGNNFNQCEVCQESIEGTSKFKKHVKTHRLVCERCGYQNERYDNFINHLRCHKIDDNMKPLSKKHRGMPQFSCKVCNLDGSRQYIYRHILNVHIKTETKAKS